MTTALHKTLKRELTIEGEPFVLTISPQAFKLVPKGKRKGHEILWTAVVSGDAALATALNASLQFSAESTEKKPAPKANRKTPRKSSE